MRRAERDRGVRAGMTSDERARLKALERESRELKRANENLRKAPAFFAQAEFDRHRLAYYEVEPICAQLPIAPSTYYEHKPAKPIRGDRRRLLGAMRASLRPALSRQ